MHCSVTDSLGDDALGAGIHVYLGAEEGLSSRLTRVLAG